MSTQLKIQLHINSGRVIFKHTYFKRFWNCVMYGHTILYLCFYWSRSNTIESHPISTPFRCQWPTKYQPLNTVLVPSFCMLSMVLFFSFDIKIVSCKQKHCINSSNYTLLFTLWGPPRLFWLKHWVWQILIHSLCRLL